MELIKRWARELLLFALIAVVISNVMSALRSPTLESDRLPSFELDLVAGGKLSSHRLKGAPVLIYFWGTWCPVCSAQSPAVEGVVEDVQVLSIAVNSGDEQTLQSYMRAQGYGFPVYNDVNRAWSERFQVRAFPTLFLYDAEGRLRFTEVGYTSSVGLRARLMWMSWF